MKIRQALVNEFTRNPKVEVGAQIEYQSLKQRLLQIAEKHAFLQKLKQNPNVLHQAIEDLENLGLLKLVPQAKETPARYRIFEIQDLKTSLDRAIITQLQSGKLTFKEIHEQLTLAFSVCLSKETVFERVNALFKLGQIVELEGKGQGALYSLLGAE